jgi:hypothetical protein
MSNARRIATLSLALLLAAAGGAFAQINLSNYVAIGDSLTAGFSGAGLSQYYQQDSFPAILARQFNMSSFQQPLVSDPGLPPTSELVALNVTSQGISPVIVTKSGLGTPINATYSGIYNNLGIPGANAGDMLTLTGNIYNLQQDFMLLAAGQTSLKVPMADLVLRDGQNPVINQAVGKRGTFYTVWIGNNDVLGAAITGVALDGITLTDVATFTQEYQTLLGGLHQQLPDAKIVVANIPDVTSIPFVTTVKPYLVNPADGSHIPLIGEAGLLTENDYLTLYAAPLIAQGIGVPVAAGGTGQPLPEGSIDQTGLHDGVILRAAEVSAILQRTAQLNQVIAQTASSVGAGLWDVNAFFKGVVAHGVVVGGIRLSADFLTGGLFGYDGIHPQRLGYAMVANEFVKVINQRFGADVPQVDLRPYLLGADTTTSVMAASTVMSLQVETALSRLFAPGALTDRLQVPQQHPVRRRISVRDIHDPAGPRLR